MNLRDAMQSHSRLHNWKQRKGIVTVRGVVSGHIEMKRLKKEIDNHPEKDEAIQIMIDELNYNWLKIDMKLTKPFDYPPRNVEEIRGHLENHILFALVYIVSGKNHLKKLKPKIKKIIE